MARWPSSGGVRGGVCSVSTTRRSHWRIAGFTGRAARLYHPVDSPGLRQMLEALPELDTHFSRNFQLWFFTDSLCLKLLRFPHSFASGSY